MSNIFGSSSIVVRDSFINILNVSFRDEHINHSDTLV